MDDFNGKVAVVTGAGTGIGTAVARSIVEHGGRVALIGRTRSTLEQAADGLPDASTSILVADHSVEAEVDSVFDHVVTQWGSVDLLVNNAAVTGQVGNIWDLDVTQWRDALEANLTGPWLCSRRAATLMKDNGGGSIVMIGSISGKRPLATRTPYTTTKMGLVGMARTLAAELGPHGIRVNTVSPGPVATGRLDELAAKWGRPVEELREEFASTSVLGQISEPSDVAAAVRFLASDEASQITGIDLTIDGGIWFQ